jgi:hypothetical protein
VSTEVKRKQIKRNCPRQSADTIKVTRGNAKPPKEITIETVRKTGASKAGQNKPKIDKPTHYRGRAPNRLKDDSVSMD